jgi:hypothetical protein
MESVKVRKCGLGGDTQNGKKLRLSDCQKMGMAIAEQRRLVNVPSFSQLETVML